MKAVKHILALILLSLFVFGCILFGKSSSRKPIETESSYHIEYTSMLSSEEILIICEIEGYVFDDFSKEPLSAGFAFTMENHQYRASIDSTGFFRLSLPPGTYRLRASSFGNKDILTEPIKLEANTRTRIKIYLGSSIMYEQ